MDCVIIITYIQFILIFSLGLVFGSFFNVVIYRLPLGISIINPPSHCPNCKTRLKPIHNIPIISYLSLLGSCSYCSYPISFRYPLIEFITGLIFTITYKFYYFDFYYTILDQQSFELEIFMKFIFTIIFISILLIVSLIDIDLFIIPDSLSITGSFLFLIITPFVFEKSFLSVLTGFIFGFSFYFFLWLITGGQGVGLGDAKLMAMIGAYFGVYGVFPIIFISSLLGTIVGLSLIITKRQNKRMPIPFGPFLSLASFIYLFISDIIFISY